MMAVDNGIHAQDAAVVVSDMYAPTNAKEMAARLADMKARLGLVQTFFKQVMVEGQDYGTIPGTDKPTLLKPGAEKLCELYGYSIVVHTEREEKCRDTGFYDCAVKVQLVSRRTGEVIAEGVGEANTYESRYRYRWVWPNQVPAGIDKSTLVTRQTRSGVQYRLENDDLFSLWNTVRKMAKKRALVDAVLSATRSSGIFTQDLEELRDWIDADIVVDQDLAGHQPRQVTRETPVQDIETVRKQFFATAAKLGVPADIAKEWAKEAFAKNGMPLASFNDIPADQLDKSVKAMGTKKGATSFVATVTKWYRDRLVAKATEYCGDEANANDWLQATIGKPVEEASIAELQQFEEAYKKAAEPPFYDPEEEDGEEAEE